MALCRPHAVMAQMSLCGGTQEAPTWASQREQLGAEDDLSGKRACKDLQQPTHLAQHSSCQLCQASYLYRICPQPFSAHEPGPPAPRVSPLPSASLRTLVLCLSFFLSSNKSFVPASSPRAQYHQPGTSLPGPASGSATAALLPSAELAVSTRSSHLTPARRMLKAVQSQQHNDSVAPPPLTTTAAAAHSPPEKAKPKACNPWKALSPPW